MGFFFTRKKRSLRKKQTLKRKKQENKNKVMIINDHEIKGWRDAIKKKNFDKMIVKAHRRGIKTIIVKDDEYADKKYNVPNEINKRQTKNNNNRSTKWNNHY